jgi:hypothetical protein
MVSTRWGLVAKSASAILAALGACRAAGNGAAGPSAGPGLAAEASPSGEAKNSLRQSKIPDGVERVYRGTIGSDLAIVMRLRRQGSVVSGRYFYERNIFTRERGSTSISRERFSDDDHIALDERVAPAVPTKKPAKATGHFDGTVDNSGGWVGTWSDEARLHPLPFRLEPSEPAWSPGTAVPLHKKRVHLVRKPEQPDTSPLLKECTFDATVGGPVQVVPSMQKE